MSWLFSQALVEEYSAGTCLDGAPCALWSGTPTQPACSWLGKTTAACRLSRSGMMFKPLTDDLGEAVLMSFLAASPAPTFPALERGQASTEKPAPCGGTWQGSLAKFDPVSSSWRTHQCLLFEDSTECLEAFPRWGMMRDGELWEQSTQVLRTDETESGLWPTPRSCTAMAAKITPESAWAENRFPNLETMVGRLMWPTPQERFGTPRASDSKGSGPVGSKSHSHMLEKGYLCAQIATETSGGQLNPMWVEWLMGWPLGWTDCAASATDKFQRWLRSHGNY
jgi:hypothetical protein